MPAPTTVEEFLDLIQKSGVAEMSRVKGYVQKITETRDATKKIDQVAQLMIRDGVLTFFQAEQLMQGKWKRFFIGKYKVLERIGTGGMGQVFLCEHKLMKRRVALKVLPAIKAQDPASLERFYREAKAVAALDHPNIVRAYDIDQDENIHFFVMEFVDGPNLQDLVKKIGPLDPIRACHYIFGAAAGLHHAHEMGLVHRDIKPGNVLVDRTGVVKVLDMGLARLIYDDDDMLTKKYDENVLGTADYLAPEQAVDSHSVDIRADIYSLGGTFYYILTGSSPFPDGTIAQKLLWHQTRDPRPIRSLRPEVPQEIVKIVELMMHRKRDERFQTPADVLAALEPYVQQPIAPPPEEEIPSISAAASGQAFSSRPVNLVKSSVMGSLPSVPSKLKSSGYGFSSRTGSNPNFSFGQAGTATATATETGWAQLTSDTQPKSLNDTARNPIPNASPMKVDARSKTKSKSKVKIAAMVIVGGLIAAGASAYYFKNHATVGAATAGSVFYVSSRTDSGSTGRTVSTLRQALTSASPGTKIVLLDERFEEPAIPAILGKSKDGLTDVTIEPGPGLKQVTWAVTPSPGHSANSALEFQNLANVKLVGLTIDCRTSVEFGISVLGVCPGLSLERVTIINPSVAGIRLNNAGGEADRPIVFDHVRISASAEKPLMSGFLLTAQSTLPNKFIRIVDGRLDGPGTDAIRVAGPIADLDITGQRIVGWTNGVTFSSGMPVEGICKINLTNNTFFQLSEAGIRCDVPMPKGMKGEVSVRQNLFMKVKEVALGANGALPALTVADNVRDDKSQDNRGLSMGSQVVAGTVSTDPANDETYLRYEAGSPFSQVGAKKVSVGSRAQ
ncbi:MAG: serine/threonine-protein kinase [Gemmataceae bacterium]